MLHLQLRRALLFLFVFSCLTHAQVITFPGGTDGFGNPTSVDPVQLTRLNMNLFLIDSRNSRTTNVQSPDGSISFLDLKAPPKARNEYDKGYQLLMRKELQGSVAHLTKAIAIYPSFVAAHNALGTDYLNLGHTEQAQAEFASAVALDDHRPNSYLNLGCAELTLKQYPAAEESLRKAASLAPLDVQLQLALAYAELMNHDYPAVIATARQVHEKKHQGAAEIHFFAAAAREAQGDLVQAQREMETLLEEAPNSPSTANFRQILWQVNAAQEGRAAAELELAHDVSFKIPGGATPASWQHLSPAPTGLTCKRPSEIAEQEAARKAQLALQQTREKNQIEEAEAAPDPACLNCAIMGAVESAGASVSGSRLNQPTSNSPGANYRATVDEVAVFFAATDHGKSVTHRFAFEQAAAAQFLRTVVDDKSDLAFVVGVSNSVLLAQDFTADQTLVSRAVNHLAPAGGTALWDAVAFAADKLASHPEVQPVARLLVVISDGQDNSSSTTLKQAIETAQRGEVAIYTVGTRDELDEERSALLGDHALRTLAELTGGTAFLPGSVRRLSGSLTDLQQVIRGRYLISYKPASFQRDGRYRTVDIEAQQDGRELKVFARKGYYASGAPLDSANR